MKAYIELRDGVQSTDELERDIQAFVRRNLAAYLYPRQIEFIDAIPLTPTGKVRRADLRARSSAERAPAELSAQHRSRGHRLT